MRYSHNPRVSSVLVFLAVLCLITPSALGQSVVLTWVDRTGKAIETVGTAGPIRGVDLASDGKRVVAHRHDEKDSENVIFASGSSEATLVAERSSQENTPAIWSPDGTRVVYGSKRNGKGGLYVKRADGTGTEQLLLESETTKIPMSWSPDGNFIVYWVPGGIEWVLPLTGDRRPFQISEGQTTHAQISPDGKWIAYQSNDTGRAEIYIKAFPQGSHSWRVSREGGVFSRWRGDSRELYFLSKASDGKIMASEIRAEGTSLQPEAPRELFDSGYTNFNHPGGVYHTFAVSRDGQRFLIPRTEKSPAADNIERNGRTLTVYDREGKVVSTIGDKGLYGQVAFSPDQTRVAVTKNDAEKGTQDIWVLDAATGKGIPITASKADEAPRAPIVWSPDGTQIAYMSSRKGTEGIYRKAANGQGEEELLVKLTGAGTNLREWSPDGRFLYYYSPQLGGNIMFAVPLDGERTPIAAVRSENPMVAATVSPNGRFIAYRSADSGRDEIYVQPFDRSGTSNGQRWKVTPEGGVGPTFWRGDGKELYFVGLTDRGIMAVDVNTAGNFEFGKPRLLFKAPETLPQNGLGVNISISRDGQKIALNVPPTPPTPPAPPPMQQISVFDREGKVVKTIGEPARYAEVTLSPDGTRLAVRKAPATGNDTEIWSYEISSGEGRSITKGNVQDLLWSPDSSKIFFVANRPAGYSVILRRAADGSGDEEELFRQTPGYPVNLSDISSDGKLLSIDVGGVIDVLPLTGDRQNRQPVEVSREEYFTGNGKFSDDGRFMAYLSNEPGRNEIYVRALDASGSPSGQKWKATTDWAGSVASWNARNNEIYYFKNDFGDVLVMAMDITPTPSFKAGTSRFLFRVPNGGSRLRNISRDGQRFVFITDVPAAAAK